MKETNVEKYKVKIILLILLVILISVIAIVVVNKITHVQLNTTVNLVINNRNVTERLKHEIIEKDGVIYLSMDDVENFFDKYIYLEKETNEIITTYEDKIAAIGFETNKLTLNGAIKKINSSAINEEGVYYLPISEMLEVYNIELTNIEQSKTITIDSLSKEKIKATVKAKTSVKSQRKLFSRLVDTTQKGAEVYLLEEVDNKSWVKIRDENGKIGYVKSSKLENITKVREEVVKQKYMTEKVNMFWDYFSQWVQAPNRIGQKIEGVNVVSPSFFYLDKDTGELKENVGEAGKAYIQWAHSNGYKVWPMISNSEAGIKITSSILNSYAKRQALIQAIVEKCVTYDIDGINIDFENMYEDDKNVFSRFIIELMPRMQEMKIVLSVDVTAPDGAPNWSMCYNRNVIGDVADYLIFMAYDQYGVSSTEAGTTAGFNWVENSLKKIIEYDVVDTEKIILGIPFYTRQWTIESDGTIKSRSVVTMINTKIPTGVEKQWNDELKQNYIEYKSGKSTIKMWLEDGDSIKEKVSLVSKYNLGGTSGWRKDMETSNIWSIIKEELQK